MADPEASASPPAPPAAAPEPVADAKKKFTAVRQCKFCGETKPVAHEQWCQKNPNRRTKVPNPRAGQGKGTRDYKAEHARRKAAKAGKPTVPAAPKPTPAPAPAPAKPKDQEAFLAERKSELKGTPPKPGEKDEKAPEKPADDKKPATSTKTWIAIGLGLGGLLLFLWHLAQQTPPGEQPRSRGERHAQDAELPANGEIPGIGPVHVPGLG